MSDNLKIEKQLIIRIEEKDQEDQEEDIFPIVYEEKPVKEKDNIETTIISFFRKKLISILNRN